MKQYSLFMCVTKTLISWKASHTLVPWSITMVGHIKKSYDLSLLASKGRGGDVSLSIFPQ